MASGAATAPGAMLTDWGFLGRFMAVSSKALLTYMHSASDRTDCKRTKERGRQEGGREAGGGGGEAYWRNYM